MAITAESTVVPAALVSRGTVRACVLEDVPGITRLFDLVFHRGPGHPSPTLEAYLRELFFDAPAQKDSSLRSYVYADSAGQVGGFIGTHPRSFIFDGQPITAAAYGQLMVHPSLRGRGIARQLCKRFYGGGQVFGFGTTAAGTRVIDLKLGAHNPPIYGLSWHKVLRPGSVLASRLGQARKLGPLAGAFRVLAQGRPGLNVSTMCETLDIDDIETVHRRAFEGTRFYPAFDAADLRWRLRMLRRSERLGAFARVVHEGRDPIGWYLWLLDRGGTGTVIEALAVPGKEAIVLDDLVRHARKTGACRVYGYCCDTTRAIAAQKVGATLRYCQSSFLLHSHNEELVRLFMDAPPRLSVFDGDGWLDFPRA